MKLKKLESGITLNREDVPEEREKGRFPPIFKELKTSLNEGDTVIVDERYIIGKEKLVGRKLIVEKCWLSDLGNMSTYLLKLKQEEGVRNPYLAHHFNKV